MVHLGGKWFIEETNNNFFYYKRWRRGVYVVGSRVVRSCYQFTNATVYLIFFKCFFFCHSIVIWLSDTIFIFFNSISNYKSTNYGRKQTKNYSRHVCRSNGNIIHNKIKHMYHFPKLPITIRRQQQQQKKLCNFTMYVWYIASFESQPIHFKKN